MSDVRNFFEMLKSQWARNNYISVGLDSDPALIPKVTQLRDVRSTIFSFNQAIVNATHEHACLYKQNFAHYVAHMEEGLVALHETHSYIYQHAGKVPIMLDIKAGDTRETNEQYARLAFEKLGADAVTVHAHPGFEALMPFFEHKEKGVFVVCRMSGEGGEPTQEVSTLNGEPYYIFVARQAAQLWNKFGNCGLVVGATAPPAQISAIRNVAPKLPLLLPGVGEQGGDAVTAFSAAMGEGGVIMHMGRSLVFGSDGAFFPEKVREQLIEHRNKLYAHKKEHTEKK